MTVFVFVWICVIRGQVLKCHVWRVATQEP